MNIIARRLKKIELSFYVIVVVDIDRHDIIDIFDDYEIIIAPQCQDRQQEQDKSQLRYQLKHLETPSLQGQLKCYLVIA
jgi:hypothetical protein